MKWAASSSGPGGSGGLIDGMRIRSRRNATSSRCAASQVAASSLADGQGWSRAGAQVRGAVMMAPMNPRTKPVSTMITTIAMRICT